MTHQIETFESTARVTAATAGTARGDAQAAGTLALEMLRNGASKEFAVNMLCGLFDSNGVGHMARETDTIVKGALAIYKAEQLASDDLDDDMFLDAADFGDEVHATQWLIQDYLEEVGLSAIWGQPGSGKSFVSLSMACSIATGTPWNGKPVRKGPVIYIVGEGQGGVRKRVQAWLRTNNVKLEPGQLILTKCAIDLLDEEVAIKVSDRVDSICNGVKPVAVFIDTLARCFVSGNENESKDMGKFVAVVTKHIRDRWECNVALIHHSGKNGESMRGSGALRGALDQEFEVKGQRGIRSMSCNKMKDGAEPDTLRFQLRVVEMGTEISKLNGQSVTIDTCVMDMSVSQADPESEEVADEEDKFGVGDFMHHFYEKKIWPGYTAYKTLFKMSGNKVKEFVAECLKQGWIEKEGRSFNLTQSGINFCISYDLTSDVD